MRIRKTSYGQLAIFGVSQSPEGVKPTEDVGHVFGPLVRGPPTFPALG